MAEKLKPCPFCGGEATTRTSAVKGLTQDVIEIKIGCCDCSVWKMRKMRSGNSIEELNQLISVTVSDWNRRARDEEKLIVLPCKVGDVMYIKGEPAEIDSIHIDKTITYHVGVLCYERDCSTCPFYEKHGCKAPDKITADDIGVTVFLTKEEAERALKECENETNV
jgi:hypothetical protein